MAFNKYLILFCLIICIIACEEKPKDINDKLALKTSKPIINTNNSLTINQDSLNLIPEVGLVYYLGKPFTGTGVSYLEGTKKATQIDYLKGKKHGFYRKWFDNGVLSFESEYLDGKKHGYTKTWWANSNMRSEANFEKGIANGVQKEWYKSGMKFKVRNLVDGKEKGLQKSWRENGTLYNNYEAKNGRIFGMKRATLCYDLDDEKVQYKN